MTYDQWKTTDPREWYGEDEDEPECEHPYWSTRWAFFTGKATCAECGQRLPWTCTRPFSDRVFDRWNDLRFWLRFDAYWKLMRPFRAMRRWWRGDRKAPWKLDDEIPF